MMPDIPHILDKTVEAAKTHKKAILIGAGVIATVVIALVLK